MSGTLDASTGERLALLRSARTVAIVGVSGNPLRASNFVASYLKRTPYRVWGVNPAYDEVLGMPCVPTLADSPETPDIVDVFRRVDDLPGVVEEAIAVGAKAVWFQLGLRHDGAAARARAAGLTVVQDRCLKIEHARFSGGLSMAGFDSGVISSRRQRLV